MQQIDGDFDKTKIHLLYVPPIDSVDLELQFFSVEIIHVIQWPKWTGTRSPFDTNYRFRFDWCLRAETRTLSCYFSFQCHLPAHSGLKFTNAQIGQKHSRYITNTQMMQSPNSIPIIYYPRNTVQDDGVSKPKSNDNYLFNTLTVVPCTMKCMGNSITCAIKRNERCVFVSLFPLWLADTRTDHVYVQTRTVYTHNARIPIYRPHLDHTGTQTMHFTFFYFPAVDR